MSNLIEIKGLVKSYSNGFTLGPLDLTLPSGCIMGFIGENGAGKTTTIKLLLGLTRPDAGAVELLGAPIGALAAEEKQQIGVVLDEGFFYDTLRTREVANVLKSMYTNWDDRKFSADIERFSIPTDKKIKEMSKGTKMKLMIACALAHNPRLLILDEATSGLDPVVRNEILDIFLDFIQDEEHSILLSSHITGDLEKIADYITYIHKGKVILSDSKDKILEEYGVVRCTAKDAEKLDASEYLGRRSSSFGCELLIADRRNFRRRYPDLLVEPTTLEEIMLFTVKNEEA